MTRSQSVVSLLADFCRQHTLPQHYQALAEQYFLPLAEEIVEKARQAKGRDGKASFLVGINGCQGSGKSTLAAFLETLLSQEYQLKVANLSIDDFYHTRDYRAELANSVHPLFVTRGVPGTHDIDLLKKTLLALQTKETTITIPRFNKATDDRAPEAEWDSITTPADIILLEGWCVGVSAQAESELQAPINSLEKEEDQDGQWRTAINQHILQEYEPLFTMLDTLVMLKAPDFDCVYTWRKKQEDKLIQRLAATEKENLAAHNTVINSGVMDEEGLRRFIEHYQRLTEHMLMQLPKQADVVFELNHQHVINGRQDNG